MKYVHSNQVIPQSLRKELNDKVLYLIENNLTEEAGITHEDIYNAYTGDGGLHGLKFNDYDNFSQYTEAKKEIENGQFFTSPELCRFLVNCIQPTTDDIMADLTCGKGNFINFWPSESNTYGCELDIKAFKVARFLYPKSNLVNMDIRSYKPNATMDFVLGNPPFNICWFVDGSEYLSQLYFCLKAAKVLKPLGIMALIVPQSFLADDFMDKGMIAQIEECFGFLGQYELPADSFSYLGVKSFPLKLQFWQKKSYLMELPSYNIKVEKLPGITLESAKYIHDTAIHKAKEVKEKMKNQIRLEMLKKRNTSDDFIYQVDKLLYDIKRNPKTIDLYVKCQEYVNRFFNEKMPQGMKYEEWQKIRLTEKKVLNYLKKSLAVQSKVERDEIRFVKKNYSFEYKAYSHKSKLQMSNDMKKPTPIYEAILYDDLCNGKGYDRLLRKKRKAYQAQIVPYNKMEENLDIKNWLNEFTIYDSENDEKITLNENQKYDINLQLQKPYSFLQWEQGSGKTLAGIAMANYRLQHNNIRNIWVISTAISIKNTWDPSLKSYNYDYIRVDTLNDLTKIKPGQFVIMTLNMLAKYHKRVKKHIKMNCQKVMLVFDESDAITNPDSKRTKAMLNCFRKCKFKLEMTGTSTRNNISEAATQIELLYNNSVNMISWAPNIYAYDKKDKEAGLKEYKNENYGKPIPAYKKGYTLFSESHLPEKITVFGVSQRNQDIYNADALKNLLDYSIITRTFEQISGKKIYEILQKTVSFSKVEREIYRTAIEEFDRIRESYFGSTGNSRKDSMMKIIQQITMLLRICAAPNSMKEYVSELYPNKIQKTIEMLDNWKDERVAIGVRHIKTVDAYANAIKASMPDRPLIIITGNSVNLSKRKQLVKEMKSIPNVILLCTQQSLSCSMNIDFINKIIIPELHYNNSSMSQFYFRFIRYTSTEWKQVYFLTYSHSIESNLLKMILNKEKLNLFMKDQILDDDDLYEKFGVDFDIFSMLMSREKDKDGNSKIKWGEQRIA